MAKKDEEILVKLTAQEQGLDTVRTQLEKLTDTLTKLKKGTLAAFSKDLREVAFAVNQLKSDNVSKLDKDVKTLKSSFDKLKDSVDTATASMEKSKGRASSMGRQLVDLDNGIQGIIKSIKNFIAVQLMWYSARAVTQLVLEIPAAVIKSIVTYTAAIDDARANLLRWEATSGQVTGAMRTNVESILIQIRKSLIELPLTLDEASKSIQAFISAGLPSSVVSTMVPFILQLKNAFKEIDFEQFTLSIVGAFNVFKDQIGQGMSDTIKFKIIFEQLLRAQAQGVIKPEQFTTVLQYMSNIGNLAGVSFEQLLAISVAITDTGIKANSAGRMFRGMIVALSSDKAINGLKKLGVEINKNQTLADQFGKISTRMVEILGKTGRVDVGKLGALEKILSREQINAFIAFVRSYEKVGALTKDIKNASGGLQAASDVMKMSMGGQWIVLQTVLKEVGKGFFDLDSPMKTFLGGLVDIARGALFATDTTGLFSDKMYLLGDAGKAAYTIFKILYDTFTMIVLPLQLIVKGIGEILSLVSPLVGGLHNLHSLIAGYLVAVFIQWTGVIKLVIGAWTALWEALTVKYSWAILKTTLTGLIGKFDYLRLAIIAATVAYIQWKDSQEDKKEETFGDKAAADAKMKANSNDKEKNEAEVTKLLKEQKELREQMLLLDTKESKIVKKDNKGDWIESDELVSTAIVDRNRKKIENALTINARKLAAFRAVLTKQSAPIGAAGSNETLPEEVGKQFGSDQFSAVKSEYASMYEAMEKKRKSAVTEEENSYKEGERTLEDHYDKLVEISEEYFLQEMYSLRKERNLLEEKKKLIDIDISRKSSKDRKGAQEAADASYKASLEGLDKRETDITERKEVAIDTAKKDRTVALNKLETASAESRKKIEEESFSVITEKKREEIALLQNYNKDYYDQGRISAKEYYDNLAKFIEANADLQKSTLNNALNDEMIAYAEFKGTDEEKRLRYIKLEELIAKTNDEITKLDNKTTNELKNNNRERLLNIESLYQDKGEGLLGFAAVTDVTLKKLVKNFTNTAQQIADIWDTTAKSMSQAFTDYFTDIIEGNLKSLSDYVNGFLKSVAASMAQALGNQVSGNIMSAINMGISTYAGYSPEPGKVHTGGKILAYHGGGEVVAKLLTGERVMSREQSSMFENMYSKTMNSTPEVSVNITNQSSKPVTLTQSAPPKIEFGKIITSFILTDLQTNGPISKTVKGMR